jgi:hypothetical protein
MATNNNWNNQVLAANSQIILNAGTNGVNISSDASAATINVGTGGAVKTVVVGSTNSTSATTVRSGTGALNVTSTNGALTINSGTGAWGLSTDASATTISLGTGAAAKTLTLGSSNTTSSTTIQAGSGNIVLSQSGTAFTAGAIVTDSSGNVSSVNNATVGYVLTGNGSSTAPSFQVLPAGGMTWSVITANQNASNGNGYICNKASNLVLTLPTVAAAGTLIGVTGMNTALGWTIAQNASQSIQFGTSTTTVGTGGSLSSSQITDSVLIICVVANTTWNVLNSVGNLTVV